jgi:uncharacterized protein (TIGR02611 family)
MTVVLAIGLTVLATGVAMLVLPGPGVLVIIVGLAILATEFAWAGYLLEQARNRSRSAYQSFRTGVLRRTPQEDQT